MAAESIQLTLPDADSISEPRKIEGRLFMAFGLVLAGGLLASLALVSDDIQRGIGTIGNAHAAAQLTSCASGELPLSADSIAPAMGLQPSAATPAAAEFQPNAATAVSRLTGAKTTARPAPAVAQGLRPAPSYIRQAARDPAPQQDILLLRRSL